MKNLNFGLKFFVIFGIIVVLIIVNIVTSTLKLNQVAHQANLNIEFANFNAQVNKAYIAHLEWGKAVDEALMSGNYSILHHSIFHRAWNFS